MSADDRSSLKMLEYVVETYLGLLPNEVKSDALAALADLTGEWNRESDRRCEAREKLGRASRITAESRKAASP